MNVPKLITTRRGQRLNARPPHDPGQFDNTVRRARNHFYQGLGLCCTLLVLGLSLSQAGRGKPQPAPGQPASTGASAAPAAPQHFAAGYVVHRDPKTGKFVASGESIPLSGSTSNAFSTSDEGLSEVVNPVQGGGFMIHLQGRFQHGMAAHLDAQGRLASDCQAAPEAATKPGPHNLATGKE